MNGLRIVLGACVAAVLCVAPLAGAAVVNQAYYRLGEAGSVNTSDSNKPQDSSGNGRHFQGIHQAATGVSTTSFAPVAGSTASMQFGGASGTTNQGYYTNSYTTPASNFGIEVWVKPTTATGRTSAIPSGTAARDQNAWILGNGLVLAAYNGTLVGGLMNADASLTYVGAGVPINTSTWTALAIVNDGGTTTFYVNGVASGSSSTAAFAATAAHLGVTPGGLQSFAGFVDEARMFTFTAGQFNPATDLTTVPEPASAGVLALAGLALARWRNGRK